jgi:THO complex subunit 4
LTSVPSGPSGPSAGRRNPFDSAVVPARSLADRITLAPGRLSRSRSPVRHSDVSGPIPANVDRYVPGQDRRSRSPLARQGRREGRRPGVRRGERGGERGGRSSRGTPGEKTAKDGRPKKTQEELDAEMDDYWGAKENGTEAAPVAAAEGDIDMIE